MARNPKIRNKNINHILRIDIEIPTPANIDITRMAKNSIGKFIFFNMFTPKQCFFIKKFVMDNWHGQVRFSMIV